MFFMVECCFIVPISFLQKSLKRQYCLWQLLNIEKDISKINEEIEAEKIVIDDIKEQKKSYENESNKKIKEQQGYLKEITKLERQIADRSNKLDKNVSSICL